MKKILIFGATSAMAAETAKIWATKGHELYLVARDGSKLSAVAADLRVRGAKTVHEKQCDLSDQKLYATLINDACTTLGELDIVLIAHGTLSDQLKAQNDLSYALNEINLNFLSQAALSALVANYFEKHGRGQLAVISSVAGDRGRQSNYVYGSAKAGLNTFLQGLRNRVSKSDVQVLTIKPGFVDTPMTANIKKNPLFVGPHVVGKAIVRALDQGKDEIYVPWFWCGIMFLIKAIPERVFKRMKL